MKKIVLCFLLLLIVVTGCGKYDKDDAIKEAKSLDKIKAFIDGHDIVKEIFVPKKIVNIVIK